jgi:hypothetical protein
MEAQFLVDSLGSLYMQILLSTGSLHIQILPKLKYGFQRKIGLCEWINNSKGTKVMRIHMG